ncbi:CAP domain-containing protein [Edaphobacillus lindanitolerans]|uniref:Cysteine-rich secretory protein family protein n=1 Tax=Edaphobacillus lindanitolerans TaxID=550447 RepID=A0A1U7PL90_9BACI|nr:CAP-associated domain-containing protein [Edaphobacillus lindanitolerans]SIT68024.1 Cysteine-rich secretory protein family protein [Edaphobacillus lindanitolerans]
MKFALRVIFVLLIVAGFILFTSRGPSENEMLVSPVGPNTALPQDTAVPGSQKTLARPESGLSVFVGGPSKSLADEYGKPDRIEPSAYGFEWWIYSEPVEEYLMAGVKDGKINQIFTAGKERDVAPFSIGQPVEDIHRSTILESEVNVEIGTNQYVFTLNGDDMQERMLVSYDGLYAQLYADMDTGTLFAVRFISPETIVLQQPYEMTYSGDLLMPPALSSSLQKAVDRANGQQVMDLANLYRKRSGLPELDEDPGADAVARTRAITAKKAGTQQKEELPPLSDDLELAQISYSKAGENKAADYVDAPATLHGWINSPEHRELLRKPGYNRQGAGVSGSSYSHILFEQPDPAGSAN